METRAYAVFHALHFALDICNMPGPLFTGFPAMMQNLPFSRHGAYPIDKLTILHLCGTAFCGGIISTVERTILDNGMDHESPQAQEWLSFFDEQVSPFYRADLMLPGSEPSQAAIFFFVDGYGFERAGRRLLATRPQRSMRLKKMRLNSTGAGVLRLRKRYGSISGGR